MESLDFRVRAYIHEYPATASTAWVSSPAAVISNIARSASSNQFTSITGRIELGIRHAFLKVVIHMRINVMLYRICRRRPNKECLHPLLDTVKEPHSKVTGGVQPV